MWITGGSSGIGAALARELVDRGARVAVSARRVERLEEVAAGRMLVVPLDVADPAASEEAAQRVRAELGDPDIVVLNAGGWQPLNPRRWDAEAFRRQVETNLIGVSNGLAAVLPAMLARGSGMVLVMASIAGYRGVPGAGGYGATKAALINLGEALRADLAADGIRVLTVCPGFVRTELTDRNEFPMPFIVDAADAARRIANGIAADRPEIIFPLPVAVAMKLARLVPVRMWSTGWSVARRTRLGDRARTRQRDP